MLAKLQKLREEREEGFTLIELLVVILIIGILSAIAIPAFMNQRKSAVDSSVQSDLTSVSKEIATQEVKLGGQAADVTVISNTTTKEATVTVTGTPPVKVKLSKGNDIKGTGLAGLAGNTGPGYTLQGSNANGDRAAKAGALGFQWVSAGGGANW